MSSVEGHKAPPATTSRPAAWADTLSMRFQEKLAGLDPTTPDHLKRVSAALAELVQKLQEVQAYESYDPRNLASIVVKKNYAEVEKLEGHTGSVLCLQALPDGRIVSGGADGTLRIWTRDSSGAWSSEVLKGHTKWVYCLQALPDGRIVSGSGDDTLRIWDGEPV